jgi:hypothetical protein
MPRTKGKYDRPQFMRLLTAEQRKERNAYYFLERLRQLDPEFKQNYSEIARQYSAGQLKGEQAQKMVWQEMRKAMRRR